MYRASLASAAHNDQESVIEPLGVNNHHHAKAFTVRVLIQVQAARTHKRQISQVCTMINDLIKIVLSLMIVAFH